MKQMCKMMALLMTVGTHTAAQAAEAAAVSPTASLFKMCLGLAIVLAVMALIAWIVKRMLPGGLGQQSVVRIVGGASVGARERVVVLEINGRWIVVGVAPGQVNRIANLEAGDMSAAHLSGQPASEASPAVHSAVAPMLRPMVKPFAEWLKKSSEKIKSLPARD